MLSLLFLQERATEKSIIYESLWKLFPFFICCLQVKWPQVGGTDEQMRSATDAMLMMAHEKNEKRLLNKKAKNKSLNCYVSCTSATLVCTEPCKDQAGHFSDLCIPLHLAIRVRVMVG